MSPKRFLSLIPFLFLMVLFSSYTRWTTRSLLPLRPNILLITLDSFRFQQLLQPAGYAQDHKSYLAELTQKSVHFSQTISPSPQSLPAHASLFTGLYPRQHRVQFEALFRLPHSFETLPEILREKANYDTAAFIGAALLTEESGLAQGFSHYDDDFTQPPREMFETFHPNQRRAEEVTEQFTHWFKQRKTAQPFFAWTHFFDANFPYEAPSYIKKDSANDYLSELYYVEQQIQQLLQFLQKQEALKDTIVIIATSSGEGLHDHKEYHHGLFLYNTTVSNTMLFHYPKMFYPGEIKTPVSLLDIKPTILDILSLESKTTLPGRTLSSALFKHQIAPKTIFIETMYPYYNHRWPGLEGLITSDSQQQLWKYISRGASPSGDLREELYLLTNDPKERNNLSSKSKNQTQLQKCRKELASIKATLKPRVMEKSDYQRPVDLVQERDFKTFNLICAPLITKHPLSTKDPLLLGQTYYSLSYAKELVRGQKWEKAQKQIQKLLDEDKNHTEALLLYGLTLIQQKQFKEALKIYEHPYLKDRLDAGLQKAIVLQQIQEWKLAEICLKQLVERYPNYAEIHKQLAILYADNGLTQNAIQSLETYFKLNTIPNPQESISLRSLLKKLKND